MTVIIAGKDDLGRASLSFRYDPTLIDLIKEIVPGNSRKWDNAAKTWWVSNLGHALYFLDVAREHGHTVIGEEILRPKQEAPPRQAISLATPDDVFDRLLHLVGAEREDKIFAALTRILHPDMSTGSLELQQALNRVRDQRTGRNVRTGARR